MTLPLHVRAPLFSFQSSPLTLRFACLSVYISCSRFFLVADSYFRLSPCTSPQAILFLYLQLCLCVLLQAIRSVRHSICLQPSPRHWSPSLGPLISLTPARSRRSRTTSVANLLIQGHRKRWTGSETAITYKVLDGFTRFAF